MDNGSTVPIVRQQWGLNSELSLLNDRDPKPMDIKGRPSPKIQVTKRIVVKPDAKKLVEVTIKHSGLILVDPDPKLFTNQM